MIEFIQTQYLILFYNIGLIIAMLYIIVTSMRENLSSDKHVVGTIVAAIIWPVLVIVNVLAVLFGNLRNVLNMLVTTVDYSEPHGKTIDTAGTVTQINLDAVSGTITGIDTIDVDGEKDG